MAKMAKTVAVIGAGVSGLISMKCCLDEGLTPVCFERMDFIGGLWHFSEEKGEDHSCVMRSTVIDTSKELMAFSDFLIPKEYANFMHNSEVLAYFHKYADHFNLKKYVHFQHEILRVSKAGDYATSGRWDLKIKNLKTGDVRTQTFDAVMVCTGHHAKRRMATFPGMEEFQGKIVHSQQVKTPHAFEGKRIVVVGVGNSGADVASELGRSAKKVYLSTRRGAWLLPRSFDNGIPWDVLEHRRSYLTLMDWLPYKIRLALYEYFMNRRMDHTLYGMKPAHDVFGQHPFVNDELPNRIICGSVVVKCNIKKITKTGVEFEDGTFEDDIDIIILATGYVYGFPFIDKEVIEVKDNVINLYKYAFPPDLPHPTLMVVGLFQPVGAIMPLAELECRWATALFKGSKQLPSQKEMWADIQKKQCDMEKRYVKSPRHTVQVDFVPFMDELAELVGCKPNLVKLFFRDPKLALTCYFGACSPYQYRLMGPGTWDGAKHAIETQYERIVYPLKTRAVPEEPTNILWTGLKWAILLGLVAILMRAILT